MLEAFSVSFFLYWAVWVGWQFARLGHRATHIHYAGINKVGLVINTLHISPQPGCRSTVESSNPCILPTPLSAGTRGGGGSTKRVGARKHDYH